MRGADVAPGRPGVRALLGEGWQIFRAQPLVSVVTAFITAAVCLSVFVTAGRAAAAEAAVVSQVDGAGARTIRFSDPSGEAGLTAMGVQHVAELPGVDWMLAIGDTVDVRNSAMPQVGRPVPSAALFSELPPSVRLTAGRAPRLEEAIAGTDAMTALGLADRTGGVRGQLFDGPVVGTFDAASPVTELQQSVLIRTVPSDDRLMREVYVVAETVADVRTLERAIPTMLHMTDPSQLRIDSPAVLVDLQEVLRGELGDSGRQLMLLALASGLVLIAVSLYGATAARKRDFGRRRALGATRSALVVLVLLPTGLGALAGVTLGTGFGVAMVNATQGTVPGIAFILGVPTLTLLTALLAAVPPATIAAAQDPVRILRVP
ncbi:FtsX-like permease family protein [Nocardioides houyundeii]|uniref:FtsX-like permease family protein n=1 Tax=Nocardioides houyundeii TaxID=2045452 RepID=UPI000C770292|nr:FtsX-like permease family protein [Nocardioides houyundeii]